jgi:hypothetical protein
MKQSCRHLITIFRSKKIDLFQPRYFALRWLRKTKVRIADQDPSAQAETTSSNHERENDHNNDESDQQGFSGTAQYNSELIHKYMELRKSDQLLIILRVWYDQAATDRDILQLIHEAKQCEQTEEITLEDTLPEVQPSDTHTSTTHSGPPTPLYLTLTKMAPVLLCQINVRLLV